MYGKNLHTRTSIFPRYPLEMLIMYLVFTEKLGRLSLLFLRGKVLAAGKKLFQYGCGLVSVS